MNQATTILTRADLVGGTVEMVGGGLSAAGRPRLPIRLMSALLYLKHAFISVFLE